MIQYYFKLYYSSAILMFVHYYNSLYHNYPRSPRKPIYLSVVRINYFYDTAHISKHNVYNKGKMCK